MAASVSTIAARVTADTAEMEAGMARAAASVDQLTLAATKSNNAMEEQKRAFHATLAPVTEADALFENQIASTVMLSQDSKRLAKILDEEAESLQSVGAAAKDASDKLGKVGSIAQQGVFAVDDFVAGFQTGGVAGGLRGAANNLSMIAMQLGNIKVALGAVAAISVGQLIVSQWAKHQAEQLEKAKKAAEDYAASLRRIADEIRQIPSIRAEMRSARDLGDVESARRAEQDALDKQRDALVELTALERQRRALEDEFGSGTLTGDPMIDERLRALAEEINQLRVRESELQKTAMLQRELVEIIREQEAALKATAEAQERAQMQADHEHNAARQLEIQQELQRAAAEGLDELDKRLDAILNPKDAEINSILEEMEKQIQAVMDAIGTGILDQAGAEEMLQQIQDAADKQVRALSQVDASLFNRLPGTATFGSSAAVSAINSASAGSRNISDSQRQLQTSERIAKATERTRELIEKAQGDIAQVVPVL